MRRDSTALRPWANGLSLARIALGVAVYLTVAGGVAGTGEGDPLLVAARAAVALALTLTAALTDYLDGLLARRAPPEATRFAHWFGRWIDAFTDFCFFLSVYSALLQIGVMPAWLYALFLAREGTMYLILRPAARRLALDHGARLPGKIKTVLQYAGVSGLLGLAAAAPYLGVAAGAVRATFPAALTVLVAVSVGTLYWYWRPLVGAWPARESRLPRQLAATVVGLALLQILLYGVLAPVASVAVEAVAGAAPGAGAGAGGGGGAGGGVSAGGGISADAATGGGADATESAGAAAGFGTGADPFAGTAAGFGAGVDPFAGAARWDRFLIVTCLFHLLIGWFLFWRHKDFAPLRPDGPDGPDGGTNRSAGEGSASGVVQASASASAAERVGAAQHGGADEVSGTITTASAAGATDGSPGLPEPRGGAVIGPSADAPIRLTLPNLLTLLRLSSIPTITLLLAHGPGPGRAPLLVAVIAAVFLTDLLDGALARRGDQVTRIGSYLDSGSDYLMLLALAVLLAAKGIMPQWLALLLAARLILHALAMGVVVLRRGAGVVGPTTWGKISVAAAMVVIGLEVLVYLLAAGDDSPALLARVLGIAEVAAALLIGVSLIDKVRYALRVMGPRR